MRDRRRGERHMLYLAIACFTIGVLCMALGRADDLDLHRQDHQLHAAASYALTVSGADILGSPVAAGLAAFALGLLKESQDQHWSPGDIKANALGCATGAVFSWAVRF